MAGTAIIQSGDVGGCFTSGYLTVMTGATVSNDISVVECRTHKCICCEMAERTILSGRQVIVGKASTDHTIMAGGAVATYIVVIKDASGKNTRSMAHATIIAGRHMVNRLTNRVDTIMTSFTQFIYDTWNRVIESFRPGKGARIVAHAAVSGNRRVVRCLAC